MWGAAGKTKIIYFALNLRKCPATYKCFDINVILTAGVCVTSVRRAIYPPERLCGQNLNWKQLLSTLCSGFRTPSLSYWWQMFIV